MDDTVKNNTRNGDSSPTFETNTTESQSNSSTYH